MFPYVNMYVSLRLLCWPWTAVIISWCLICTDIFKLSCCQLFNLGLHRSCVGYSLTMRLIGICGYVIFPATCSCYTPNKFLSTTFFHLFWQNVIFGIFASHNHNTSPSESSSIHYYAALPPTISCPRYAINNSSRVDCSPYDMVTFMVFPLPVSTLIAFSLISIFSLYD